MPLEEVELCRSTPNEGEELQEVDLGITKKINEEEDDVGFKRDRFGNPLLEEDFQELQSYLQKYNYTHPNRLDRWQGPGCLGSATLREQNPNAYKMYLRQANPDSEAGKAIRTDRDRTYPKNPLFEGEAGQKRLEDILLAYSHRNPDVGYCQGMNSIVGFLMLMAEASWGCTGTDGCAEKLSADEKDERVFWMLVMIVEQNKFNAGYYTKGGLMAELEVDIGILKKLTKKLLPKVYQHMNRFERGSAVWHALISGWWIPIFTHDALPSEALVKVWDAYVLEGRVILFRIALAMFQMFEDDILSVQDIHIVTNLRSNCRRLYNCGELLQVAFYAPEFKAVTERAIAILRSDVKDRHARQFPECLRCKTSRVCGYNEIANACTVM
eukprot:TRINITY_DN47583_c0_g1_i1.p1 TRINITY_DN47583_c0_g1~~TRINITY_DN47583_c0_g1_i1.p1  ORF type:complete len:383 (-),score=17.35 TRINITY_DN47583_c0_g1_i1:143-1291(-)